MRIFVCAFILILSKGNSLLWKDPYVSTSVSWVLGLMADKLTFPSNAPCKQCQLPADESSR